MAVYSQFTQSPDGFYDAFGRARVSSPTTLFDSQMEYDAHSAIEGNMGVTSFSGGIAASAELNAGSGARSGSAGGDRSATDRLPFGLDIDGANPVPLALTAYALENNVTASFAFDWEEVR